MAKQIKFSTLQLEFIQLELNIIRTILKIQKPLHFTTDISYFRSVKKLNGNPAMACDTITGLIWIDEKYHCENSMMVLQSNLWHEALHIKHPKKSERQIKQLVRKLTGYHI